MSNTKYPRSAKTKAIKMAQGGMSNADIAFQMRIPENTIKTWTAGHHKRRRGGSRTARAANMASLTIKAGRHLWWSLTGWAPR